MRGLRAVLGRELHAYWTTPVAWLFLIAFLLLAGVCTFSWVIFSRAGKPI